MQGLSGSPMFDTERVLLVVQPPTGCTALAELARRCMPEIETLLLSHGALLFRGFSVETVEDFAAFVAATSLQPMEYVYRSTPRTRLADSVFTATEYPPSQEIPLHNENSYQRSWPLKVAFCCLVAPASGGQTPIADMRRITARLGGLVEQFAARGVRYVRHYREHVDLSWQTVFQTNDRAELARFCRERDIEAQWLDADTLRTTQVAQGTARHPQTGERVFFNQAHLFHVSSVGARGAQSLIRLFGQDRLPRHALYGDGTELEPATLEQITAAFRSCAISFRWQRGDVLLLDNMQVAHGRRSFTGARTVLTALLDPNPVAHRMDVCA